MSAIAIGTKVRMDNGKGGKIVAYTIFGNKKLEVYAIVELDRKSAGYMEGKTTFISHMVVHHGNLKTDSDAAS